MAVKITITAERLRQLLDYNPDTGDFVWKYRYPNEWQKRQYCTTFNKRFAGKKTVSIGDIGYPIIQVLGRTYHAHRLAWLHFYGVLPDGDIDHINMNKTDNRISNLRLATRSENMRNSRKRITNKSGFKGVSRASGDRGWVAQITVNRKAMRLGVFQTKEEAASAYAKAAEKLHGDFSRVA